MAEKKRKSKEKSDEIFRQLTVDLNGHISVLMEPFRTKCNAYLPPCDIESRSFFHIIDALERIGEIDCYRLSLLKKLIQGLSKVGYDLICEAEKEIAGKRKGCILRLLYCLYTEIQ